MFGNNFTHEPVSENDASAMAELVMLDRLSDALLMAAMALPARHPRPHYLNHFETFVANRRRGLKRVVEGAGLMYCAQSDLDGRVMPIWFRTVEGQREA